MLLIGDGCFNYNPIPAGLWASKEYALPILIVIYNNGVYQSMGMSHLAGFPEGWCKKNKYSARRLAARIRILKAGCSIQFSRR